MIKKHLAWLGCKAKDRVTGFSGVVSSVSFDLYGCVTAWITPGIGKDGKPADGVWYDVKRLQRLKGAPVMRAPDFEEPEIGAERKGAPW